MRRTFRLPHAIVEFHPHGAVTHFAIDGTCVEATPHWDDQSYLETARSLGYGDDIVKQCQEHELFHSLVAELLHGEPSKVLWEEAHGLKRRRGTRAEEDVVLRLQRELRRGIKGAAPR